MTPSPQHICSGCDNLEQYGHCKKLGLHVRSQIGRTVYESFIARCGCASDTRSRPSPAPKCDLEIIHCQTANCVKCKEFLDKRDAAIVAATRNDIVSAILTRITEAQFDKSTMQDFINYVESLRSPSAAPEQEK